MKRIIGVDEAGRGALAGPVAVGVVSVPDNFDWTLISGVRDSKQLSPKRREDIFTIARRLRRDGVLDYRVALVSARVIDRIGITRAVAVATARGITRLNVFPEETEIRLDGLLHAPKHFSNQQTIIRGDQTEPVISLASIMAKVTRDRLMERIAPRYVAYSFEVHKGYGTAVHKKAIMSCGLSDIHRQYFCRFAKSSIRV